MTGAIRVLIADDQRVVREGLALVLGLLDGVEVVGAASDGNEAVALAVDLHPDGANRFGHGGNERRVAEFVADLTRAACDRGRLPGPRVSDRLEHLLGRLGAENLSAQLKRPSGARR